MDAKLEKVLGRLKQQYESYEKELQEINEEEDGIIDISVACSLANSVPYLIKTIEEQEKENQWLYGKLNQIGWIVAKGREESKKF